MLKLLSPRSQKQAETILRQCSSNFSGNNSNKAIKTQSTELEGTSTNKNSTSTKKSKPKETKKEDLVWRKPWHEGLQYYDTLRSFYKEDNNATILKWIQQPIDFSPSTVKKWWLRTKGEYETYTQQYLPERHSILGPELASAHFIVARGGAVKFHNENKWIKAVDGDYALPSQYQKGMFLQAIDCTDMRLQYEGLANLRGLRNVEWLSLNGCRRIDDFCMDVISNIFSHSLLYLDLRNCFGVTERGLGALYRMDTLRILYLDDMLKDTKYELTCLLLEELNQNLHIKSDVINFEIK